jgi:hypothetical protein
MIQFGMRFMRLVVMELLEESHGVLTRYKRPAGALEGEGLAIGGLCLTDNPNPQKWKLESRFSGSGFSKRSIQKGDIVLVTRDDGRYEEGLHHLDTVHSAIYPGEYPCEAKVQMLQIFPGGCAIELMPTSPHRPPTDVGSWRIDKLGNFTSYERQIKAITRIVVGNATGKKVAEVDLSIQQIIAGSDAPEGVGFKGIDLEVMARVKARQGTGGKKGGQQAARSERSQQELARQAAYAAMGRADPLYGDVATMPEIA